MAESGKGRPVAGSRVVIVSDGDFVFDKWHMDGETDPRDLGEGQSGRTELACEATRLGGMRARHDIAITAHQQGSSLAMYP